ncbi:NAD-dependent epimerase/dehydratase family protein [Nakamurella flavida]|uniref:NAD-dependent epimerase/dehydratase family protein n=1 Tax=Nakamurella flavida TaxID=363630 RepID=A0A938YDM5_9ACTN|nr:NAD-dependent epimerase/dehydratase family protein [Nakamurella flavida]MBM9475745.1 NAD-dependent epimerase/dehydratase family protein [Nakamurella flavida]MDP9777976.1 UDP-glucose 4-epimerase [Nakamurella flavida]
MSGRIVLVTGVTRYIGSALAGLLAAHPDVERVIGVDAALPEPAARARMAGAEFARVDIRNPLISRVIDAAGVDTVVHASASAAPLSSAARTMAKEMNVLGTMQLLAACQRADSVAHLVVRSTAAVYGSSPRDPAVFCEDVVPRGVPTKGPARDAVDIEGYVRGFGRRRPDVRVAVPRFAEIIGPTVQTPATRYLSLSPIVPTLLGRDARLQLVHETDAVAVMQHLALGDFAGIVNVAGSGVLTLTQAVHRAGRVPLPLPSGSLGIIGRLAALAGVRGFAPEQLRALSSGRVLDTRRLTGVAGFRPAFTTAGAFDDFVAGLSPALSAEQVRAAQDKVAALLGVRSDPGPATADAADAAARPTLIGIPGDAPGAPRRRRTR